jgi:hypothetical protein
MNRVQGPMPLIPLRTQVGVSSPNDLQVEVQQQTIEYLSSLTFTKEARVSAYLDRDWPLVEAKYGELVIEGCAEQNIVLHVSPGSRTRSGIQLPGPMKKGEQLTLQIERRPKA